jgi:hypothetical protein
MLVAGLHLALHGDVYFMAWLLALAVSMVLEDCWGRWVVLAF